MTITITRTYFLLALLTTLSFEVVAKERLIIKSIDALGWNKHNNLLQNSKFASGYLKDQRSSIEPLKILASGNTGPSHVTAYTGFSPKDGGWIGNAFKHPLQDLYSQQIAFNLITHETHIQHIVTKLSKRGRQIACLNSPTINRDLGCSLFLGFSPRVSSSCGFDLSKKNSQELICGDETIVLSSNNNKIEHNGISQALDFETVTPICWVEENKYFSRLAYKEMKHGKLSLYISPKHRLNANKEFIGKAQEFACWPGVIDGNSIRMDKITSKGFYNISKFQHDYSMVLLKHVLSLPEFDTVFSYSSFLDNIQHELLASHGHYEWQKKREMINQAFNEVSADLGILHDNLEDADSLLLFSDHGMVASTNVIMINGLLTKLEGLSITTESANVRAYVSGGLAHIYFDEDSIDMVNATVKFLKEFSVDNKQVFSFVNTRDELVLSEFNHANSGNIVLMVNPGFGLDPRLPPTNRVVYPSMSSILDERVKELEPAELMFLQSGTSNRASPGIHGLNSKNIDMDGLISGTGSFERFIKECERPLVMTDVFDLIVEATLTSNDTGQKYFCNEN